MSCSLRMTATTGEGGYRVPLPPGCKGGCKGATGAGPRSSPLIHPLLGWHVPEVISIFPVQDQAAHTQYWYH